MATRTIGTPPPLDLRERAIATMRRASDGGERLFASVRRVSDRVLVQLHKARSDSQSPSALERLWEQMVTLLKAGASPDQVNEVVVETRQILQDAIAPTPATPCLVLAVIAEGNVADASEALAESQLLTRGDRQLTEGDLSRLEDATRAEIAVKERQLSAVSRLRRQLRLSRGLVREAATRAGMTAIGLVLLLASCTEAPTTPPATNCNYSSEFWDCTIRQLPDGTIVSTCVPRT